MKTKILIAMNIVLVAALVLSHAGDQTTPAWAGGPAATSQTHLAITATNRNGFDTLYIIDTEKSHLIAYEMQPSGLTLVAARRLTYDFKIESYKDNSKKGVRYIDLKEKFTPKPNKKP